MNLPEGPIRCEWDKWERRCSDSSVRFFLLVASNTFSCAFCLIHSNLVTLNPSEREISRDEYLVYEVMGS